jgi:hypothetical protein
MLRKNFIKLPAVRPDGPAKDYEAIINTDFIHYAVPTVSDQVGKTIVMLAQRPSKSMVATKYDLDTLAREIPHLTPVEIYNSRGGEVGGRGLVNLARVLQVEEHEKFVKLVFVDDQHIAVTRAVLSATGD